MNEVMLVKPETNSSPRDINRLAKEKDRDSYCLNKNLTLPKCWKTEKQTCIFNFAQANQRRDG